MIQAEVDTLARYAFSVPLEGHIVEIGTHAGGSTIVMAEAAPDALIWTIDTGGRWVWEGHRIEDYGEFLSHRFEPYPNIVFLLSNSHPVGGTSWFQWPIDLLFIDGDHNHAAVMADLECWADKVTPQGRIIFHDYVEGDEGKVWNAANEYLSTNPQWKIEEIVQTMLICRKKR